MMHPPPSQGRIRNPLGNISALTKDGIGSCDPASERSQICMPQVLNPHQNLDHHAGKHVRESVVTEILEDS